MNPKIYLICFADSRLQKSTNRLKGEVSNFKMIDEVHFYGEEDLEPSIIGVDTDTGNGNLTL